MNAIPVYVFAKWQVKEGNLQQVLTLLKEAAQSTAAEEGNLLYKLHQSSSDPNTILLYEGYVDEAAAMQHRESDHYQEIVVKAIIPLLDNREVVKANLISFP